MPLTITLDDETAAWARDEAARANTTLSGFVAELLRREMETRDSFGAARDRYLDRTVGYVSDGADYPPRAEVHTRR